DDFEHHGFRELDADRPLAVQLDLHHHPVLQEGGAVADEVLAKLDLLEVRRVHEYELLGLAIKALELPPLERGLLDAVAAAEALVELAAIEEVFELDLIIGGAFAGFHRAGLDRGPERAVMLDDHAWSDVAAADLGHDRQMPRRRNIRQGLTGRDCVDLGAASGNGVGPSGVMRAIQGLALFSAMDRSIGFMLRMKSSRN